MKIAQERLVSIEVKTHPLSMIRRQRGMISVVRRKLITYKGTNGVLATKKQHIEYLSKLTSCSSVLTSAPMTPREVSLRYSNGLEWS